MAAAPDAHTEGSDFPFQADMRFPATSCVGLDRRLCSLHSFQFTSCRGTSAILKPYDVDWYYKLGLASPAGSGDSCPTCGCIVSKSVLVLCHIHVFDVWWSNVLFPSRKINSPMRWFWPILTCKLQKILLYLPLFV